MSDSLVLRNLAIAKYQNGLYQDDKGEWYKIVSLSQPGCRVISMHEDEMESIIECPNCGHPTKYGNTRMISGNIGCDNEIAPGKTCYFDDLYPRILKEREVRYNDSK